MPLFGSTDADSDSPISAPAQFGVAPNTANRDALFGNTTGDAFVTNQEVGVFGVDENEVGVIDTVIVEIDVTAGGTDYDIATTSVGFSGGGGSGATATAVIAANVVTGVTITDPGTGYTSAPTVTITDSGSGSGATATADIGSVGGAAAHTGWHIRTEGTGGRAGRVHFECLVAGGISTDASDDVILPDS